MADDPTGPSLDRVREELRRRDEEAQDDRPEQRRREDEADEEEPAS